MTDLEDTHWVLGCHLTVRTRNEEIQGQVFAFDKASNTVLLSQTGSTPFHSSLRLLKANYVKSVEQASSSLAPVEPLPQVDLQRCRDREAKALQAARAEAAKTGIGVSSEAQQVFDALSKTMPCQWKQQSIVVLNEVELQPPYGLDDCSTAHPHDLTTMERVKKVLTAERRRLGLS